MSTITKPTELGDTMIAKLEGEAKGPSRLVQMTQYAEGLAGDVQRFADKTRAHLALETIVMRAHANDQEAIDGLVDVLKTTESLEVCEVAFRHILGVAGPKEFVELAKYFYRLFWDEHDDVGGGVVNPRRLRQVIDVLHSLWCINTGDLSFDQYLETIGLDIPYGRLLTTASLENRAY